jgi:TonB family protein
MMSWRQFAVGILLAFVTSPAFAHHWELGYDPSESISQITAEKSGAIPTKQGLCLYLNADPGNVQIFTDESGQVSYRVVVEADSRDPGAEEFLRQFTLGARRIPGGVSLDAQLPWRTFHGRFGVTFEIHVPRRYNLKINTQGGNIDVQDIEGQVDLATAGGNITAGRVGALVNGEEAPVHSAASPAGRVAARLETQGGHITIGDAAGTLRAETSGGHIITGNISGDGILRTGGGHIQTGRIAGVAKLETGGGNIRVERTGSSVTADTAGGQIDFDEAAGAIRVHTGGGAVHIDHVTGPTVLEANGGGIFLRQVDAPLHVSAGSGSITAWLNDGIGPEDAAREIHNLSGASQLSSGGGDIIVYLPRQLAATIDAVVERGGGHSIVADPSLPLRVSYQDSGSGPRTIRCEGKLNGGGEVLHLKAVSGNIILKLGEPRAGWNAAFHAAWMPADPESPVMQAWNSDEDAAGFFEEFRRRILETWWGGVPVDADEMQKHLEHSVAPVYPNVARRAGIEGDVALRVYVSGDGRVTDLKVLGGPPILARAAVEAVQQWQYQALKINGRPANVVTTLIVAFRLK